MKLRFFIMLLYFGICSSGLAQIGGFSKWENLYSDGTIKVEISFQVKACSGSGESNNRSKYRYRVNGKPKSVNYHYINWKMDFLDCNGNLYYRNNALNIGSYNTHFKLFVTDLVIYPDDEDFTCKSLEKPHYDVTLSYSKSYGSGIKATQLRNATTSEIADIWNGKYGINPERRDKLISMGIDPDDAQRRINSGEGKPLDPPKADNLFSVSPEYIFFDSNAGRKFVNVKINEKFDYNILYLPEWCKVDVKGEDYFTIICDENNSYKRRSDWFKVNSGDKDVKLVVTQEGKPQSIPKTTATSIKGNSAKCYNCPKTNHLSISVSFPFFEEDGHLIGLNYETLFKSGFGARTGILLDFFDRQTNIVLPVHLRYRFNFSKNSFLLFYGMGFKLVGKSRPFLTNDFGFGFQFNRFQIMIERTRGVTGYYDYDKPLLSTSLMFPLSQK